MTMLLLSSRVVCATLLSLLLLISNPQNLYSQEKSPHSEVLAKCEKALSSCDAYISSLKEKLEVVDDINHSANEWPWYLWLLMGAATGATAITVLK